METHDKNLIKLKFEKLKAEVEVFLDRSRYNNLGWWKEGAFSNSGFESFCNNLENVIPTGADTINELDIWIKENDKAIDLLVERIKKHPNKTKDPSTSSIFLKARKELKVKLLGIMIALTNDQASSNELPKVTASPLKDSKEKETQGIKAPLKLSDFFVSDSKYNHIMNLLVEKGFCQENTFIWKDDKKGNKAYLAAILKHLHSQQYYKNNKRLTNKQIKEIAQNTFGWEMGIDTIKKTSPNDYPVNFIPPASTLK